MKKLLISATITALLASSAMSFAKGPREEGELSKRMMAELSLTPEQKSDLRQIKKEARQDSSIYRAERTQFKDEMRTLMQMETWDEAAVSALIEERMDSGLPLKLIQAKAKNQSYNVMTTEQKEMLAEKRAEKMAKRAAKQANSNSERSDKRLDKMAKRLDLSEQQKLAIGEIFAANKALRDTDKAEMQGKKEALSAIIQAPTFDEDAWLAFHAENKEAKLQKALLRAKSHFDILSLLNAEQKEEFTKMMKKEKHKKGEKRGGKRRDKSRDSNTNSTQAS
jgi:protein CpxP